MMNSTPTICLIHGLNSSALSFTYLEEQLKLNGFKTVCIEYESHQSMKASIKEVYDKLPDGPIVLLGHSLGGIIALNISYEVHTQKVITISSPLAGSRAATIMQWFSTTRVISDITPHSPEITSLRREPTCEVLSIVSTAGHLASAGALNDSVVSLASQGAINSALKVYINANHFEILLSPEMKDAVITSLNS